MTKNCLICSHNIEPFISFGPQPIANGFLLPDQFKNEYFFQMDVAFCPKCTMVQLMDQPDREKMFHSNYAFYSSTSSHMAKHFEKFANEVMMKYQPSFVVEIGSNDGIMLKHFANKGIKHLGIEPSANVADESRLHGVNVVSRFFDESLAEDIVGEYGQADCILSANVMAHIPDLHSVFAGIKKLLKPGGVLIFEDPYMGDILEKTSYDQIYDEHAFFFSLNSIEYLAKQHGMETIDAYPQETHGGSMRYTVANRGTHLKNDRVRAWMEKEEYMDMDKPATYEKFRQNVEKSRENLLQVLTEIKRNGGNIVGYAATAKSATITNYCEIGPDLIDFICDTTPIKQGKFSPGMHIPVKSYAEFTGKHPSHSLLFAWNHTKEIMEKETGFKGKWIVYVPEVKVL